MTSRNMTVNPRAPWPSFAIFLSASLLPALAGAQSLHVVTTVLDGDPLDPAGIRTEFAAGDRLSINILLDTGGTAVETQMVAVGVVFPAGSLEKLLRPEDGSPGTGWPLVSGKPVIRTAEELPPSLQPHLGAAFVDVSTSSDNEACPCDEENGAGMEALVHFLLVDTASSVTLPPGLHHLFQTDWVVPETCRAGLFEIQVTDGPAGRGLRGAGQPLKNIVRGVLPAQRFELGRGLQASGSGLLELGCAEVAVRFLRGDPDSDGRVNITDAVVILQGLFRGTPIDCERAADTDASGQVVLSDAVRILNHLFRGGPAPEPPFPDCGPDPAPSDLPCLRGCS